MSWRETLGRALFGHARHHAPPTYSGPRPTRPPARHHGLEDRPPRQPNPINDLPPCGRCTHGAADHDIRKADRGCDRYGCECLAYTRELTPMRPIPMAPE